MKTNLVKSFNRLRAGRVVGTYALLNVPGLGFREPPPTRRVLSEEERRQVYIDRTHKLTNKFRTGGYYITDLGVYPRR